MHPSYLYDLKFFGMILAWMLFMHYLCVGLELFYNYFERKKHGK